MAENSPPARATSRCAAPPGPATISSRQVDISIDYGASWKPAQITAPRNRYDWQRWTATVKVPSDGYYEVWVRATDNRGNRAAAHHRQLESAGLWRQRHAPDRGAGGLTWMRDLRMRPGADAARCRTAFRGGALTLLLAASCSSARCVVRPSARNLRNSRRAMKRRRVFRTGAGRDDTFYACTRLSQFQADRGARPVARGNGTIPLH